MGDYLAEFTSELETDDYIEEFVSGGPKNYGYKTKKGKVECNVRGFRLNSEGKTQLNYDIMRQNVLDEIQHPQKEPRQTQVVKTYQIVHDAKTYDLYTYLDYKRYQLVCDKRVLDPSTFQTYPYGYTALAVTPRQHSPSSNDSPVDQPLVSQAYNPLSALERLVSSIYTVTRLSNYGPGTTLPTCP